MNKYAREDDDWTPARGWAIALRKASLRCLIAFVVQTAVLYFVWPMLPNLPLAYYTATLSLMAIPLAVSGAVGLPTGYLVARKLSEDSGLAGLTIMLPVLAMLIAAAICSYLVASIFRDQGGALTYTLVAGFAIWSVVFALKSLATQ